MGNDLTKGQTFVDGSTYNASNLNALVDEATLKTTVITARPAKTSPVGADLLLASDSEDSNALKKLSLTNLNIYFQNNINKYAVDSGTANTYAVSLSVTPTSYTTGLVVFFKATNTNTGASTINVSSLGAKNIYLNNAALVGGEILANGFYLVVYDGTQFQLVGQYEPAQLPTQNTIDQAADLAPFYDASAKLNSKNTIGALLARLDNSIAHGRLTLSTGTPVTTSDVSASNTIYYAPFVGNKICLYNGTIWSVYDFSELSLALGSLNTKSIYDVFIYNNSGTLTLESLEWNSSTCTITGATNATPIVVSATNSFSNGDIVAISGITGNTNANGIWRIASVSGSAFTLENSVGNGVYGGTPDCRKITNTRATALVRQDGVLVKSGDATRRYLGTFMTDLSSATCTDISGAVSAGGTAGWRGLWNCYNRTRKFLLCGDTTNSWNYTTAAWRPANAQPQGMSHRFVVGVSEDVAVAEYLASTKDIGNNDACAVGIGLNRTENRSGINQEAFTDSTQSYNIPIAAKLKWIPSAGFNFVTALEYRIAATPGFMGDDSTTGVVQTGFYLEIFS